MVFEAPRLLLYQVSSYFGAALAGGFQEGATQTISMAEDEVSMFELFIHWLCCGKFTMAEEDFDSLSLLFFLGHIRAIPSL